MAEKGVQVIDRVFDILELLVLEGKGLGVTEIAKRLELSKSTVHRILNGIANRGYLEKSEDGIYSLGIQFVELASRRLNNVELVTEARPYLSELTSIVKQSSHLAILDESDAVYIDKVELVRNLRLYSQIGKRIPIYCSGLGKSLLLDKDDSDILERFEKCRIDKLTKKTKIHSQDYLQEIRQSRKNGYTVDDEEHDEGIRCIAAPVYDYRGKIVAAISVAGPCDVIAKDKEENLSDLVKKYALLISKRLGYLNK
ncbi:MAG: IclR family transcriptional regulator [Clostridium sp.]|nr:IclR family transcriptional regulator [Clostridium sp.]